MKRAMIPAAVLVCMAVSSCNAGVVHVRWNSPGIPDGASWDTAFRTVSQGITASVEGDEIRVAQGTYTGQITPKAGTTLSGGWSGVDVERDPKVYVTTLDGNDVSNGTVVIPSGATTTTRIDGFTITGGYPGYGGGINCANASATITNNLITGNGYVLSCGMGGGIYLVNSNAVVSGNTITRNITGWGAGIYCEGGSPSIKGNVIANNHTTRIQGGGGIACRDSNAVIENNVIYGNMGLAGGGICIDGGTTTIVNNTIAANADVRDGGGIYINVSNLSPTGSESATIANNIVAFGSSGICKAPGIQFDAVLKNNCVYGNKVYDYQGIAPGLGDISKDPLFASREYGNIHIQPNSPCRDAGDDAYAWGTDMDGQPRVQGTHVDIGADESDATTWSYSPRIIRVKIEGDDANDGSAWHLAKRTVQAAIDALGEEGGEVWVRGGTYPEQITIPQFVYLYGGFTGMEETREARNWAVVGTFLEPANGPVVTLKYSGFALSTLDGFTVTSQNSSSYSGILCQTASPLIANNTIINNSGTYGGGVFCEYTSPLLYNCTIAYNRSRTGGGVRAQSSRLFIEQCRINANRSTYDHGSGICCDYGTIRLSGNLITDNTAYGHGGGLYSDGCRLEATNNTFAGNSASAGGAVYLINSLNYGISIRNNTIVENSSGIYGGNLQGELIFTNNCFYENSAYDTQGMPAGADNLFTDPLFADTDYHVAANSPCVDAGCDSAVGLPTFDMDGQGRIFGASVDIGADEYWSSVLSIRDVKKAADGAVVSGSGAIVTAVLGNSYFYIEADDRSSGIRVEKILPETTENARATVSGTLKTLSTGERCISADAVSCAGSGSVKPLGMINRNLGGGDWDYDPLTGEGQRGVTGGHGLNNIGLLVTISGEITDVQNTWFMVDDGSDVGVKVRWPVGLWEPEVGEYVIATGISSMEKSGEEYIRLLQPRRQEDIEVVVPAPGL